MNIKKEAFLDAYLSTIGNITESCKAVKIHRRTYYLWLDSDPEFKEAIDMIEPYEMILDVAEHQLFQKIREGDLKAIFYLLNNKGKSRGYGHPKQFEAKVLIEPITGIKVE